MRPYIETQYCGYGCSSVEISNNQTKLLSKFFGRGDPQRQPVTNVCAQCNNGWMSQLQARAKSELISMIEGTPLTVLEAGQRVISAWVTMAVMAGEYFFDGAVAVPAVERLSLKLTSSPLDNWKIWAGSYARENWPAYFVHGARFLNVSGSGSGNEIKNPAPNTQASSFVVGSVFYHAFSCPSVAFTNVLDLKCEGRLAQIWPPRGPLAWPPPPLSEQQADRISTFIFNSIAGDEFRGLPLDMMAPDADPTR